MKRFTVVLGLFCLVTTGFAQQKGWARHAAVQYDRWLLDLETLRLVTASGTGTPNLAWNVDLTIRQEGRWAYADRSSITLTTGEGKKLRLSLSDRIVNDAITGFTISCTEESSGKKLWEYTPARLGGLGRSMRYELSGDSLFLAIYGPISSGSDAVCIHLQTGKSIWEGEVQQLMISHSKYRNEVYIRKIGDRIVLAGDEAGGKYVQVLDAATGKNLFSTVEPEK